MMYNDLFGLLKWLEAYVCEPKASSCSHVVCELAAPKDLRCFLKCPCTGALVCECMFVSI